jgi:hypothetical protein
MTFHTVFFSIQIHENKEMKYKKGKLRIYEKSFRMALWYRFFPLNILWILLESSERKKSRKARIH